MNNIKYKKIGNYILSQTLGSGTFSKVKLGTHIPTSEKVAIKILDKIKIKDENDLERINREIAILKKLRHKNIAQLYETIISENHIYIIMEYIPGKDLFHYINSQKTKKLSKKTSSKIFRQLINTLEYIHKLGIVHRDIKPENILLTLDKSNIKLVDFGLSNVYNYGEYLITACGSPCYAAPEMIKGLPYKGAKSDLWSVGVVLYIMLIGKLPFDDEDIKILYKKIKDGEYSIPNDLDECCKDIIKNILEVDPEKRFGFEEIKKSKFYLFEFNEVLFDGILLGFEDILVDYGIVEYMYLKYYKNKINKDKIILSIKNNEYNSVTTTYYLLKKKKEEKGGIDVSLFNIKNIKKLDFNGKNKLNNFDENNNQENNNNENNNNNNNDNNNNNNNINNNNNNINNIKNNNNDNNMINNNIINNNNINNNNIINNNNRFNVVVINNILTDSNKENNNNNNIINNKTLESNSSPKNIVTINLDSKNNMKINLNNNNNNNNDKNSRNISNDFKKNKTTSIILGNSIITNTNNNINNISIKNNYNLTFNNNNTKNNNNNNIKIINDKFLFNSPTSSSENIKLSLKKPFYYEKKIKSSNVSRNKTNDNKYYNINIRNKRNFYNNNNNNNKFINKFLIKKIFNKELSIENIYTNSVNFNKNNNSIVRNNTENKKNSSLNKQLKTDYNKKYSFIKNITHKSSSKKQTKNNKNNNKKNIYSLNNTNTFKKINLNTKMNNNIKEIKSLSLKRKNNNNLINIGLNKSLNNSKILSKKSNNSKNKQNINLKTVKNNNNNIICYNNNNNNNRKKGTIGYITSFKNVVKKSLSKEKKKSNILLNKKLIYNYNNNNKLNTTYSNNSKEKKYNDNNKYINKKSNSLGKKRNLYIKI